MHTKFTLYGNRIAHSLFLAVFCLILGISNISAQTPWSGVYGNEWLAGKYGQEWIKISVSQKGIHKVTLTGNFIGKANKLHLYHRGVEVALISATNSEIEFYGVPNDGKSDELLYRKDIFTPDPTQRTNPYFSYYSDISAYFLTYSDIDGVRAVTVNEAVQDISVEPYHLEESVKSFTNHYSLSKDINFITVTLLQSYLENGKGPTSEIYGKIQNVSNPNLKGDPIFLLPIKNLYVDQSTKPQLELLIYGRTNSDNDIGIKVGKAGSSLRAIENFTFSGFTGVKKQYLLEVSDDESISDVPKNGDLNIGMITNRITASSQTTGLYSVTYLKVTYPQLFNMDQKTSAVFNLKSVSAGTNITKVVIDNPPSNAKIYDISDLDNPKILTGQYVSSKLNVMIPRQADKTLRFLVTSDPELNVVSTTPVAFVNNNPLSYNYLIITNDVLKVAADEYALYRNSQLGGSMNPIVVNVTDVYNQFNYGEPSPVAIRRFVDYMISKGIRANHNLLLLGHSISEGDQLVSNKELVGQVPTIGFPGSDILLVQGLKGTPADVPAIPVGRVTATTVEQLRNYKEKVEAYEQSTTNLSYRRKAMHINGGVNPGESDRFSTYYTNNLDSKVTSAPFLGTVLAKKKESTNYVNPFTLDISSDVNTGVGFISYFGHGNPHYSDNNIGYISDERRGYNNIGRYPVMYFNGCGVGNIFTGSTTKYPDNYANSDKDLSKSVLSMSADWLLAFQAGAVAVIGNSYYAFESSSRDYLFAMYDQIFPKADIERNTIGKIHQNTARFILTGSAGGRVMAVDNYSMANTHQSLLQGDPALHILWTQIPFPVELYNFNAKIYNNKEVRIEWKTAWEKNNSHFVVERSYNAKNFSPIGSVEGKGNADRESSYQFFDSKPIPGINYYRLKQVDTPETGTSKEVATYSTIVSVNIPDTEMLSVFPNPVSDVVTIRLNIPSKIISWKIHDLRGELVSKGTSSKEISVRNLVPGEYIVEMMTTEGETYSKKIVKQ
ncbi:C25 family cysteine peptidase [Dyadobacter sp. LHD-138]|uniref:putative type IX secretion system sortase PorU2 n=1 Tax=Dyadobacter sp. LHD-138 TaxID=3071413 RepID=UPI0027E03F70|nr:C25 family cysteine peptidase [Dyadobacter sp. LHD-138]MDQ6478911.1 C25 family cysteine peptidase [Dyadobacter sp. LHD-138]